MVKPPKAPKPSDAIPDAQEPDTFAQALETVTEKAPQAPQEARTPTGGKHYPPFKPDAYRGNPVAVTINSGADVMGGVEPGTASSCNLGEAYVYAAECYLGVGDAPPWMVALMATGGFAVAVVASKARAPPQAEGKGDSDDDLGDFEWASGAPPGE